MNIVAGFSRKILVLDYMPFPYHKSKSSLNLPVLLPHLPGIEVLVYHGVDIQSSNLALLLAQAWDI